MNLPEGSCLFGDKPTGVSCPNRDEPEELPRGEWLCNRSRVGTPLLGAHTDGSLRVKGPFSYGVETDNNMIKDDLE